MNLRKTRKLCIEIMYRNYVQKLCTEIMYRNYV